MTSLNIAFLKTPNPQFMKPQGLIMVKMLCQSENKNKKIIEHSQSFETIKLYYLFLFLQHLDIILQ
jgi:hypothetical protein